MPEAQEEAFPDQGGRGFRMELVSNRGEAMEKMGRTEARRTGLLRRFFDLFL